MAYSAWSVSFGEQPSASKWNLLGANDATFQVLHQNVLPFRAAGTNGAFNNTEDIVQSVAVVLAVQSVLFAYGSFDARVGDTTVRSCQSRIQSITSAVTTSRSAFVFQATNAASNIRTQFNAAAVFTLAAGTHSVHISALNGTDSTSVTTDNSHIEVLAIPYQS